MMDDRGMEIVDMTSILPSRVAGGKMVKVRKCHSIF
jgi:hypothetical protein